MVGVIFSHIIFSADGRQRTEAEAQKGILSSSAHSMSGCFLDLSGRNPRFRHLIYDQPGRLQCFCSRTRAFEIERNSAINATLSLSDLKAHSQGARFAGVIDTWSDQSYCIRKKMSNDLKCLTWVQVHYKTIRFFKHLFMKFRTLQILITIIFWWLIFLSSSFSGWMLEKDCTW